MKKFIYLIITFIMITSTNICFAMNMSCDFKEIGNIWWPVDDGFYKDGWTIKGFNIINGDKFNCTAKIQNDIYAHCIENTGNGKYDRFVTIGDINKNNVVRLSDDYAVGDYIFYKINNTLNQDMYLVLKYTSFINNNFVQLIARNSDGKWFTYADSLNTILAYGHKPKASNTLKEIVIENDSIILKYKTYNHFQYNGKYASTDVIYEITYKWDDSANWFSVSHRIVSETASPKHNYSPEDYKMKGYSNGHYTILSNR